MEEIIKAMLLEGIDEDIIHKVLDVIEEEYIIVEELEKEGPKKFVRGDIFSAIKKAHGEPEEIGGTYADLEKGKLIEVPHSTNKAHKLIKKAEQNIGKEVHQATMKRAGVTEPDDNKWTGKERNKLQDAYDQIKSNRQETKNIKGEQKTHARGVMADIVRRRETGVRPNIKK